MNPPTYTRDQEKQNGFVLGDDSDDEESELPPPPPPLEVFDPDQPPAYNDSRDENDNDKDENGDEKGAKGEQCNLHYIKPDETLLGLSMKYGVEVSRTSVSTRLSRIRVFNSRLYRLL